MSVASDVAKIMWIQSILTELNIKSEVKSTLWYDNQSTIYMSANSIFHLRIKHIEIDLYFVREKIQRGNLQVNYLPVPYQHADALTKALSK